MPCQHLHFSYSTSYLNSVTVQYFFRYFQLCRKLHFALMEFHTDHTSLAAFTKNEDQFQLPKWKLSLGTWKAGLVRGTYLAQPEIVALLLAPSMLHIPDHDNMDASCYLARMERRCFPSVFSQQMMVEAKPVGRYKKMPTHLLTTKLHQWGRFQSRPFTDRMEWRKEGDVVGTDS